MSIVRLYAWLPVPRAGLVAVTVKLGVPATVGVPLSAPALLSVRPAGRLPEVTVKVNGPTGPDAVIAWLYADPIRPFGSDAGATTTGAGVGWTSTDPMSTVPAEIRANPAPR